MDYRSDTTTKLEEININLSLQGDDVYNEDIGTNQLQTKMSSFFGKDAGLFTPSGTMSNLIAILAYCNPGDEVIVGTQTHINLYEQGNVARFGGVKIRNLPLNREGEFDLHELEDSINDSDDIHMSQTKLICLENTNADLGGKCLTTEYLRAVKEIADKHNCKVHIDGARIWNAVYAMKYHDIHNYFDSMSVCLSKCYGAPIGNVLVGDSLFYEKSLRIRKALGGGMRQTSIITQPALQMFDDWERKIKVSHDACLELYNLLATNTKIVILDKPQTNILYVPFLEATKLVGFINNNSHFILAAPDKRGLVRIVIHHQNAGVILSLYDKIKEFYEKLDEL
jgi:threonine aldolase